MRISASTLDRCDDLGDRVSVRQLRLLILGGDRLPIRLAAYGAGHDDDRTVGQARLVMAQLEVLIGDLGRVVGQHRPSVV
jgi:hypothetical protein